MLDRVVGNIFSLPKKYPFRMDDIHINGKVGPMAMSGYRVLLLCNKLLLMKGAIKNSSSINRKLKINASGRIDNIIFLLAQAVKMKKSYFIV